ncbi:MAG: TPM domain-containing protein [bacterium]
MKKSRRIGLALLSLWIFSGVGLLGAAPPPVPPPVGYVNDRAGLLSERQRSTLESTLRAFEQKTTDQVVLLTVPSLEGEDIEGYSMRVAEQWKIGQKGKDNGVLFLVAVQDRNARIEVGYGLEGVLTDALSSRILRGIVLPAFKQGNYYAGIAGGLEAILQAIEGEFKAPEGQTGGQGRVRISGFLLLLLFLLLISSRLGRLMLLGGFLGGGMGGRSFGGRSGGGFGGFSGGGGGFGGGGASGRW